MANYKKGKIVKATVTGIEPYGIFVGLDDYYSGLIHISEICHSYVKDIHSFVKVGDSINVQILDVDEHSSHLKLSIKNINYRDTYPVKRKLIKETPSGFTTLRRLLPLWIDETKKKYKKTGNSIDN